MKDSDTMSEQWKSIEQMLTKRFGKTPNMEAILFLIGIQELGQIRKRFTKEQKQDLMHIAVCTLLSQSGYYQLDEYDQDGWPHFTELKEVPGMDLEEQENFLKQHIIQYFNTGNVLNLGPDAASR
jgi:hypothetical protein